jgi:hypothetical protein
MFKQRLNESFFHSQIIEYAKTKARVKGFDEKAGQKMDQLPEDAKTFLALVQLLVVCNWKWDEKKIERYERHKSQFGSDSALVADHDLDATMHPRREGARYHLVQVIVNARKKKFADFMMNYVPMVAVCEPGQPCSFTHAFQVRTRVRVLREAMPSVFSFLF